MLLSFRQCSAQRYFFAHGVSNLYVGMMVTEHVIEHLAHKCKVSSDMLRRDVSVVSGVHCQTNLCNGISLLILSATRICTH